VIQDGQAVVITAVAVEQALYTSGQGLELRAGVGHHPLAIGTVGFCLSGQLLAEVGVRRRHGVIAAAMWPTGSSAATANKKLVYAAVAGSAAW
jgi:hypothetical protein